ncbi:protein FAR1-RELATED SEQUENCE 5-like [Camellia sinensis]|uniref:protein FAR1-RELATED SEQUENCE 5-like n=1 Tax=Camellia sinensis TaxID=4442 RepID=UPI0010355B0F|nr:protein FAR1-RELATED SEQUENCE 5-like [Camellia sinensis]
MEDNTEQNKNNIIYELVDDDGNDGEYNIHNEDDIVNSNNIPTERDIKRLDELTEKDVFEMTFDSEENGERFYNSYAKVKGFSIRRDQLYKDKNNMVISRSWVCSKEGYRQSKYLEVEERKREPKQLTRVGCRACFRIKYNRSTSKYEVNEFFKEHNHSMIGPLGVQFLRSHRNVTSADKAQGNAMHHIGMRTSHIMDFAAQQAGGYENVGFIQKDMYNHFGTERRVQVVDGDAEGALAYLCGKEEQDPMFYYKYDVDEENRLNNLFWTDGGSRTDYLYFGDVLMFDTTYRTNAYNKPFVILQGVSNHFQTTVFGCALLASETVETYIWVLEKFLDAMDHKMPLSVITDGDKAMCRAIKTVMPTARHRLCKWHLKMNALSNIHIEGFLHSFEKCMSMQCTQEMFELEWKNFVDKYGRHNNKWIAYVYCKRTLWAEAYLHGHFFAGAKSTQRCKSMNAFLNRFLKVRLRLFEFVRAYDRALARLRHNEAKAQSETENTTPILSTGMKRIERHAADIFTRAIFFKFREQIKSEQVLFMSGKTSK